MDKKLQYEDESVKAEITVHSATNRMGVQRQIMISDAVTEENKIKEPDTARYLTRTFRWPLLMAASEVNSLFIDGKETQLSFDVFCDLPDLMLWKWEQIIYELNPHWQFGQTVEGVEELEKKAKKPTSG